MILFKNYDIQRNLLSDIHKESFLAVITINKLVPIVS